MPSGRASTRRERRRRPAHAKAYPCNAPLMSSSRIRGLRGKRSTSPVATFDDTLRDDRRVREQTQLARQRRDQRAAELQAMLASTESKPRLPASARSRAGRLGSGSPPRSPRAVATSSAPLSLPLNVYTPPPLRTASALAAPHTPTAPPALLTTSTPTPSTDDLDLALGDALRELAELQGRLARCREENKKLMAEKSLEVQARQAAEVKAASAER